MKIVLDTNCLVPVIVPSSFGFVDCAITAGATFIVSNDKHFAELEKYSFPKVDVRTLTEFLNIVRTL